MPAKDHNQSRKRTSPNSPGKATHSTKKSRKVTRAELVGFYQRHKPENVEFVDDILGRFDSGFLDTTLTERYGESPIGFFDKADSASGSKEASPMLIVDHFRDVQTFRDATPQEYHVLYKIGQPTVEDALKFDRQFLGEAFLFWLVDAWQLWSAEQKKSGANPPVFKFWNEVVAYSIYDMIYEDAGTQGYPKVDLSEFDVGIYEAYEDEEEEEEEDEDEDEKTRVRETQAEAPDADNCRDTRKVFALALRNFVIKSADHFWDDITEYADHFWSDIAKTIMRIIVDLRNKRDGMVIRGKRTFPRFGDKEVDDDAERWGDGYDHAAKRAELGH